MINTTPINTLLEDNIATNNLRAYRRSIGSTQQARYAFNWWKVAMAILTYGECTSGGIELRADLDLNMKIPATHFSGLLPRAINGADPDEVRREYAKQLPDMTYRTGLQYRMLRPDEDPGTLGRPAKYVFYFEDAAKARRVLLEEFPDMLALFMELDRICRVGW